MVNAVLATDIADKELGAARKERWAKAFAPENCAAQNKELTEMDVVNRKATIVIEHIIQASDGKRRDEGDAWSYTPWIDRKKHS